MDEAVLINAEARLRALKATFFLIAGISLLAIFPAMGLPKYAPGKVSNEGIIDETAPAETKATSAE